MPKAIISVHYNWLWVWKISSSCNYYYYTNVSKKESINKYKRVDAGNERHAVWVMRHIKPCCSRSHQNEPTLSFLFIAEINSYSVFNYSSIIYNIKKHHVFMVLAGT